MSTQKIAAAFAIAVLASTTWAAESAAPASEQAKKQLKQKSAAAKSIDRPVQQKSGAHHQALDDTTKRESKKYDTLSKASKARHNEPINSIRNQR